MNAEISNIDITIIAEKPRIAPHREAIGAFIAKLLDLPRGHVNVKATTTDHLGFIGRGEGICAMAIVCLIEIVLPTTPFRFGVRCSKRWEAFL